MFLKPKIGDVCLIVVFLLFSFFWFFLPKNAGDTVTVSIDGTVVAVVPLSEDAQIVLDPLTVVVEDGYVFVTDAICPDLLCQYHAPVSDRGEGIFCLPNRVAIRISGENEEVDGLAQ